MDAGWFRIFASGMLSLAFPFNGWVRAEVPFLNIYGAPLESSEGYRLYWRFDVSSNRTVNNSGVVVGAANVRGAPGEIIGDRSYKWSAALPAGVPLTFNSTVIGGTTDSLVYAINELGEATGSVESFDISGNSKGTRAAKWDTDGNPILLDHLGTDLGGYTEAWAGALNDLGAVVGSATKHNQNDYLGFLAIRWEGATMATSVLSTPTAFESGRRQAIPYAINNSGTVVGYATRFGAGDTVLGDRAARWNGAGTDVQELDGLGTNSLGYAASLALAINEAGTTVGYASTYAQNGDFLGHRAVKWDSGRAAVTELGNIGTNQVGYTESQAIDINSSGMIIGDAWKFSQRLSYSATRALRWNSTELVPLELRVLGDERYGEISTHSRALNDAGAIVGYATEKRLNGFEAGRYAVLWLPGEDVGINLNTLIDPSSGWHLREALSISDTGWIAGAGSYDPDGTGPNPQVSRQFLIHIPAAAVPEPSVLAMLIVVLATFWGNLRNHSKS